MKGGELKLYFSPSAERLKKCSGVSGNGMVCFGIGTAVDDTTNGTVDGTINGNDNACGNMCGTVVTPSAQDKTVGDSTPLPLDTLLRDTFT